MELDESLECDSMNLSESEKKQPNVGMVKQEVPETDEVSLQDEKLGNVSTDEQFASTSFNTFDVMSNRSLELKSETVAQDYWLELDEELSVKGELLHEEIDIKSEDETTQEGHADEKHKLGNNLPMHRKYASKIKHFKCNICHYSCGRNGHLKTHLRTHTGEKPFKCNICDSNFNQKSNLIAHLRTHTGEKPFNCNICNSYFSQKSSLNIHLRIHSGEKRFKCNICGSNMSDKSALRNHLRIHTGEKPFKCNVCNKTFSQKINLKTHMITHSREKPY